MPQSPADMVWALTSRLPAPSPTQPTLRREVPAVENLNRPVPGRSADSTLAAVERGFTDAVARQLRGGVLKQSDRQGLLRAAERLHIERFRANLIIALVQRERGHSSNSATPGPSQWLAEIPAVHPGYRRTLRLAALAVGIELVVGVSAYCLCFH